MSGDIVPGSGFRLQPQPGEIRKDFLLERYTIFAPERARRPFISSDEGNSCPFCAGHERETLDEVDAIRDDPTAINQSGWRVRVVPNLYPVVRRDQPAYGVHDVVIECPHHEVSLANLTVAHLAEVLDIWCRRIVAHRNIPGLEYVKVFKNQGSAAGASVAHAHSQVLSLDRVPTTVKEELEAGWRHHVTHRRCAFCDLIDREMNDSTRLVDATEQYLSVTAYASRFPFETWILPRRHHSHFEETTSVERRALAECLHQLLRRLQIGLCDPPFNLVLHNAPLHTRELDHYHWHLEILPRLSQPAGFEWGTNWGVNLVPPEQAAEYLRGVL